jgi:tetratricopeptide (TPR) repeat protein
LESIRLNRPTIAYDHLDHQGVEQEYAAALREAGLGEEGEAAEVVAGRIRDSAVREQLVAALDYWAAVTTTPGRQAWLLEVARRADPDPWRDRFRDPRAWCRRAALEALVSELLNDRELLARQKPELLAAFGHALREAKASPLPLLKAAQVRHPDDFWLNFELGVACGDARRWPEAAGYFRAALGRRPESAVTYNNLGQALSSSRDLDGALSCFRRVVELEPRWGMAHYNLGIVLQENDQPDEAIAAFRRASELEPGWAMAHFYHGYALRNRGRASEAVAAYRKACELSPGSAQAHCNLGVALLESKRSDEAIREFLTASDLRPGWAAPYNNLGIALYQKNEPARAIRKFRRACQLAPRWAEPHGNLGSLLAQRNQFAEAIRELRAGCELDRKAAGPRYHLAWLLATCADGRYRDGARAVEAAKEAVALAPREGDYWKALGVALYRVERLAEAVAALERGLRESKEAGGELFFLAMCHHRLGAAARARDCRQRGGDWLRQQRHRLHAITLRELTAFQAEADAVLAQPPGPAKK